MQTNTENGLPLKAVKYIKFCCFDNTNVIESAIMLLAILKMQPLPKITKMATMAPPFKIKTCNKHQKPLNLGLPLTLACCLQSCWYL